MKIKSTQNGSNKNWNHSDFHYIFKNKGMIFQIILDLFLEMKQITTVH